jgi:hypothetical protein
LRAQFVDVDAGDLQRPGHAPLLSAEHPSEQVTGLDAPLAASDRERHRTLKRELCRRGQLRLARASVGARQIEVAGRDADGGKASLLLLDQRRDQLLAIQAVASKVRMIGEREQEMLGLDGGVAAGSGLLAPDAASTTARASLVNR